MGEGGPRGKRGGEKKGEEGGRGGEGGLEVERVCLEMGRVDEFCLHLDI